MKKNILFMLLIGGGAAAVLLSCTEEKPFSGKIEVTDGLGRTVVLENKPERVVSLAPSLTESIYELGAEERLVAVTDFCDYPPEAGEKPSVGGLNPSTEQIISFSPDLIVVTTEANYRTTGTRLMELGYPVYVDQPKTLADIPETIKDLGTLLGVPETANETAQRIRDAVEPGPLEGEKRPTVLYAVWLSPIIAAGGDNYIDDLIKKAGGINAVSGVERPWPRINFEALISWNVDILLYPDSPRWEEKIRNMQNDEKWLLVPAVREGRLYAVNEDIMNRPSPRIVGALERVRSLIEEWRHERKE